VVPIQIHECARGGRSPLSDCWPLALRAICGAFLLAAFFGQAQEQLTPQDQEVVDSLLPPIQQQRTKESATASALATLHGVVRNAATGEPLPRALVRIEGDAESGTLTDGEGRFELSGVPVGPQIIQVRKPGFQDRPYATEDVDYQRDGPAHNVLVAAEMPDLDFALSPTSAIHGHVELSTADPGQGITLTLLKQVVRNGRALWAQNGTTKTNGEGAYRFANLPAGVYALFTQPTMESEPAVTAVAPGAEVVHEGYPSVFYPEAREFSGATRIRLAAGQQAEANLQLKLEPFYTVTATAMLPNGKPFRFSPSGKVDLTVMDAAGRRLAYTGQFDQGTNTFQANLPEGVYSLLVSMTLDEPSVIDEANDAKETTRRPGLLLGFTEFAVVDHAITNLRIPLALATVTPIHLRVVRTAQQTNTSGGLRPQSLLTVTAINAGDAPMGEGSGDPFVANTESDSLELMGTSSGHSWLSTQIGDPSLCIDSFTAGGINLAREPLNVALGASPPPMELTLHDDCAKLALTLPPALSEFLPGDEPFYTVYVVPDFDTTVDVPPVNMHASSGPTLTMEGLTPGNYHVYVFDRPVRLEYRNPEAIAALPKPGLPVTLTAGSTTNLLLEVPER